MKNLIIGANWKSNKTKSEAKDWIEQFYDFKPREGLNVILFPPDTLLDYLSSIVRVNDLPLKIGAQDVSSKRQLTGQVPIELISEFAEYVLVGHSETRRFFTNEIVKEKLDAILSSTENEVRVKPVICFSKIEELDSFNLDGQIVAYEPLGSIGTGYAKDPGELQEMIAQVKNKFPTVGRVLYGGSVNHENIVNYLSIDLDGFLVGTASLDASEFIRLLSNV